MTPKQINNQNLLLSKLATREYIEEELKPKGMDFSEYINLVKEAFASQDLAKKKFSYGIQKGETSNQLRVCYTHVNNCM